MNTKYGIIGVAIISLLTSASASAQIAAPDASSQFSLNAAGATFPFPLIDLWRVEYAKEYPNVSLNYQSIGSGGGIKQHIETTVNFAASDAPMRETEARLAPGTLHIPETIGAIAVVYNIPEIPESGLRLDGETLSMIYLGEITMWNDGRIAAHNEGITLPEAEIITAHRSDGSGTTFVFTDYLSTVNDMFDDIVGTGKSVPWPGGIASAGNEGVARIVLSTAYSIGYVELAYVFQTGMSYVHMQNGDATSYVEPSIASISAASSSISAQLPRADESWYGVSMVNAPGPDSYPISSMTYLLVYDDLSRTSSSAGEARAILHIIHWMLTEGQSYSESLLYVPMPSEISQIGIDGLETITYDNQILWGTAAAQPVESSPAKDDASGGCLIATAAYGTELAPQVQMLREVRDGTIMTTDSGRAFMGAFNSVYYVFSPTVADIEAQSPELRSTVRALISPMLSTLAIMSLADADSDVQVLGLGMLVITLNIGMYVAAPVAVASLLIRMRRVRCNDA